MKSINIKNTIQQYIDQLHLSHILSDKMIGTLSIHYFNANEVLFNADDCLKYLYILLNGQAGVIPSSEKGRLSILDMIVPGDVIGDIEYFNNDNYYYQVTALTDCTVLAIPIGCIDKYLSNNVDFYRYISKNLAQKMKRTSLKYSRTLLYPVRNRLAKYLCDLATINGLITDFQTNHIADYLGISTRHLRRILMELEQEGIILRENSMIKIVDINKLKQQATYQ